MHYCKYTVLTKHVQYKTNYCKGRVADFSLLVISPSIQNGQNVVRTDRNQSVGGLNVHQNFSNTTQYIYILISPYMDHQKSAVGLTDWMSTMAKPGVESTQSKTMIKRQDEVIARPDLSYFYGHICCSWGPDMLWLYLISLDSAARVLPRLCLISFEYDILHFWRSE